MRGLVFLWVFLFFQFFAINSRAQELNGPEQVNPAAEAVFAGRIFDERVTLDNYLFVKGALIVFGNKFGAPPRNPQEEEGCIWDQLLLSYEAFRRGIVVDPEEIEAEVRKILETDKAVFDFKSDRQAYEKWVKEKVNAPVELFENQVRHLLQLQKLRQQVMDSITPSVSLNEAKQEFLNEYNSLSLEVVEFADLKGAAGFYEKAKRNPKFWDEEKDKKVKEFRRPGFVALEFLMDIWKFSKEALYKMLKLKPGSIYPPVPIYKGYGVSMVLETRLTDDMEFEKPRIKESYYAQIRIRRKYEGLDKWFTDLKKQANIEVYKQMKEEDVK